ncbi:MAG: hypothetical protein ABL949_01225 [Fimbriimonadaceae bacterium]
MSILFVARVALLAFGLTSFLRGLQLPKSHALFVAFALTAIGVACYREEHLINVVGLSLLVLMCLVLMLYAHVCRFDKVASQRALMFGLIGSTMVLTSVLISTAR